MSDLKHKSLAELYKAKEDCLSYMNKLKSNLSGQQIRLQWIEKYIFEKTEVEMSIEEIEAKLGHRVIIK